jgi:L-rhamnose mutarotase
MTRVCFQLQVEPSVLDAYIDRHSPVSPEMLREIAASGRTNYSIFVRPDGLLIGYFEVDDLESSAAYLAASRVAADWEAQMAPFFGLDARPDQSFTSLTEVFNLDDQLAALSTD